MKKILLTLFIAVQLNNIVAQSYKNNITFELRYPVPTGENFINKAFGNGYKGLIDMGVGYNFLQLDHLGMGILFNSSFLNLSEFDMSLMILSPKIGIEYKIPLQKFTFVPHVAFGYSNFQFTTTSWTDEFGNVVDSKHKENLDGITFKGSARLLLNRSKRLEYYLQLAYEFTKLEKWDGTPNISYNRNIQILYPGIGLVYKFKYTP